MGEPQTDIRFVPETVLKRDHFSETVAGHAEGDPTLRLALRRLDAVPRWTRWLAWALARREIAGLRAVSGIEGTPDLLRVDRVGLLRTWSDGTPLHLARPGGADWYRDARRLLREMRRRGVAHNDLAKPQNWLMTPEGRAAVIDFQLASRHPRRGRLFRALAYEDLRHLLKQKRAYAKAHLTPTERRILARRALPSRIWMATGKRLYLFVTRRLMHWSDSEGAGDRLSDEGPAIARSLRALPDVREVMVLPFARPSKGVGLYAFVETALPPVALVPHLPVPGPDLLQTVPRLPRRADGSLRDDILALVATNRIDELDAAVRGDETLADSVKTLVSGRLNLTDRQLRTR